MMQALLEGSELQSNDEGDEFEDWIKNGYKTLSSGTTAAILIESDSYVPPRELLSCSQTDIDHCQCTEDCAW